MCVMCVRERLHVRAFVGVCVCALAGARECSRTCNRACVRARICLCERDLVRMRACVRMRVLTRVRACDCACMCVRESLHVRVLEGARVGACGHAYLRARM